MTEAPGTAVGIFNPVGDSTCDGCEIELVGTCDNEGTTDTLGSRLRLCVPVGAGDSLGAAVVNKPLLVWDGYTEITLGKLLELELSGVGPSDAVGIVGTALDAGSIVETATGTVGIEDTLGC